MDIHNVLKRPLVTEKSTLLQESQKYVFEVDTRATKAQIEEAVSRTFDVTVLRVNVMTISGERFRRGPHWVRSSNWKKAVVTLAPSAKIELFEGA